MQLKQYNWSTYIARKYLTHMNVNNYLAEYTLNSINIPSVHMYTYLLFIDSIFFF